jgi:CBS domain-containing protein
VNCGDVFGVSEREPAADPATQVRKPDVHDAFMPFPIVVPGPKRYWLNLVLVRLRSRNRVLPKERKMYAHGAMSTSVVVVNPEEPAARAADLLIDRSLTGLPVVDAEGYAVGVVSDLDLISALRHGIDLNDTTVSEVMDIRPLFVEPDTDLETVVDLMEQWRVRRLPVCERGRVIGVISRGDVLRALHTHANGGARVTPDAASSRNR